MPLFFNMSIAVHNDADASKEWGWVQVGAGARRNAWPVAERVGWMPAKGLGRAASELGPWR